MDQDISSRLQTAIALRAGLLDTRHEAALRLFNGFYEGCPELAIDLYGRTLLLHNYADEPEMAQELVDRAQETLLTELPWITAVAVKTRHGRSDALKRGVVVFGTPETLTKRVREDGVWYAVDLLLNRDASLYLDTRNLRAWAREQLGEKTVLNTFAYTGSLGVAAQAGGARRVVQLDLNRSFLNVAKTSYTLNGFPIDKANFQAGDFWTQINQLKRRGERFDCVFVDPPFFAATTKGTVDLQANVGRVINKVRPLIEDGGSLVAVNNALFVSGAAYLEELERLCADGYLSLEQLIPVPDDFTGYPETRVGVAPVDPTPFNHPTKIAVLRVRRKQV
ncbi:MAG: class I SAM-dependent methyltransferase [Herpetosiphonaceae bacterium]|nr:class I SAM-dependent methyltransferase [Herpetosiphonaceae bacterium]